MSSSQTQNRILDTALALFNEKGVSKVSVNRIADAGGISRGNLHYHFRTKEEIVTALFDRMAEDMKRAAKADRENLTVAHFRTMFDRYVERVWAYRFFFRELTALTNRDPLLRRRYHAARERRMAELITFFNGLIEGGQMACPAPPVTVSGLVTLSWITCDNWIAFLEAGGEPVTPARIDEGFTLVMSLFAPYLKRPASTVPCERPDDRR
jgi:AcrR family transcriptional regulator